MRKFNFWSGGNQKLRISRRRRAPRARQGRSLRGAILGLELLEDRYLLTASPLLTVPTGQFFAVSAPVSNSIPFRATFTDVIDTPGENASFTSVIDWGDGSFDTSTDANSTQTLVFHPIIPIDAGDTAPGDPVVGRLEGFHTYADVGSYNVTVTLTDGSSLSTIVTTVVNVYPVDPNIQISGAMGDDAPEGSPFTVNLSNVDGPNVSIDSWTINWGDSIEVFSGNPSQATHTFGDDRNYGHFDPTVPDHGSYLSGAFIGATVTGANGTFAIGSPYHATVNDVPAMATVTGASDVNEGQIYTLNLSYTDPGDPLQGWAIVWDFDQGGTDISILPPDATSATHVYTDGGTTHTILALAVNGFDTPFAFQNVNVIAAPTADFASDGTVNEGSAASVSFSDQFDSNAADMAAGFRYAYDFNNDGIWEIGDGTYSGSDTAENAIVPAAFVPDGDANYTIKGRIIALSGAFTDYTTLVSVANVAPTLAISGAFSVAENSPNGTVVGTVTASDPGTDTLTYSIIGGTGAAAFAIDSMTGEITVLNGSLLDFETTPTLTLDVQVDDGDGGFDTALITIDIVNLASISGVVYVDVNQNGQFDANEPGIDGVVIKLLDQYGDAVLDEFGDPITAVTGSGGYYLFEDVAPGVYQVLEMQPTGVTDGAEQLGSLGGTIVANDLMQLTLTDVDAFDYVFAEIGQQLTAGDAAGIGFWQNKHGQQLITQGGTQLADWLTANFSNIFGNTLVGASGADVATFYREQLFKQQGKKSAGPAKVDAQFMAVALATYFTSSTLAGQTAATFGFNVTDTGIGTKIVNVGTKGAAFAVANGSDRTIMQLLLATNGLTDQPDATAGFAAIYDADGNGVISTAEANLRTLANSIFGAINEAGGI